MMAELLANLIWANLAVSVAILAVLILRLPVRRLFGARLAYALWALAPLAFSAGLVPPRNSQSTLAAPLGERVLTADLPPDALHAVALVWATGAGVVVTLILLAQMRFLRRARLGQAGPAVVGVIAPRLVTPADFETSFTPTERELIRAHERAHIERNDPKANAVAALLMAVCWFNPLVHLAAAVMRLDQELACDATVMATRSCARKTYAGALLKAGLTGGAAPLGCHWLTARHPIETRIGMLVAPAPSDARLTVGAWAAALLVATATWFTWAAKPPAPAPISFEQKVYDRLVTQQLPGGVVMIRLTSAEAAALPRPGR